MILSHEKKFIFIHIYKVAGLSIREVLQKYDDRNFNDFSLLFNLKLFLGNHFSFFESQSLLHIKSYELKEKISEKIFNNYFKFSFVRNPWDWQVSLYHFMMQYKDHPQNSIVTNMKSFDEYIEWRIEKDFELQKTFIYDRNNNKLIDFVGRFENLQNDFNTICQKILIPETTLPKTNVSIHTNYKDYYNDHTKNLVYNAYKEDIDLFNYDF